MNLITQLFTVIAGRAPVLVKQRGIASFSCRLVVAVALLTFTPAAWTQGVNLQMGDIIVVDPNAGPCSGGTCSQGGQSAVFRIKPDGSAQAVITSNIKSAQFPNGLLQQSVGVVADPNDSNLLVTDRFTGVIRVNPFTGTQTQLSSGSRFKDPFALALDGLGQIWVADSGLRGTIVNGSPVFDVNVPGQIILVNRTSGAQSVVATGGFIAHPYGIAFDPIANMLYVSSFDNVAGAGSIVAVNPGNGSQTLIWGTAAQCAASGNSKCAVQTAPVACPMGLAVEMTGNIIATAFNVPPYGCGNPGIIRVHLDTTPYSQKNLSVNPPVAWRVPFGIGTEADQSIVVVDEGFGALYHLNSTDGSFISPVPLSSGGLLFHPTDLNIVKFTPTAHTGTTPTAPSNLTATATASGTINLSWTASTDAVSVTGYLVERCQGTDCRTFAQIATATSTSYSDSGLTTGTTYSYRVRATDAANNLSGYSNVASATVPYGVSVLYDQAKDVESGSTLPVKLQLVSSTGVNISSSSIVVHAVSLRQTSTGAPGPIKASGNANPDNNFRFDSDIGTTGGYIFNLSTKGLATGTYALGFKAGTDPTTHTVQFKVK